jgi:hypothetical protein
LTEQLECKQPSWGAIRSLCELKIKDRFEKYGNSWVGLHDDYFWNNRLQGEVNEVSKTHSIGIDERMEELIDVINVCAMQITNLIEAKQRETVMMRLGL